MPHCRKSHRRYVLGIVAIVLIIYANAVDGNVIKDTLSKADLDTYALGQEPRVLSRRDLILDTKKLLKNSGLFFGDDKTPKKDSDKSGPKEPEPKTEDDPAKSQPPVNNADSKISIKTTDGNKNNTYNEVLTPITEPKKSPETKIYPEFMEPVPERQPMKTEDLVDNEPDRIQAVDTTNDMVDTPEFKTPEFKPAKKKPPPNKKEPAQKKPAQEDDEKPKAALPPPETQENSNDSRLVKLLKQNSKSKDEPEKKDDTGTKAKEFVIGIFIFVVCISSAGLILMVIRKIRKRRDNEIKLADIDQSGIDHENFFDEQGGRHYDHGTINYPTNEYRYQSQDYRPYAGRETLDQMDLTQGYYTPEAHQRFPPRAS